MTARFRSRWQQIKQHRVTTLVVAIILVAIALIIVEIRFYGTGFAGKTLWDWLQLLIIPAVLAIGGYVFNLTVSRNEQKSTKLRDQTERNIATDNQQEAALQAYIDKMSELLLDEKLRESADGDEVRNIARVRTLTVLPRLDKDRKRSILQFLYESGLINKDKTIISLHEADLHDTDLSYAKLSKADLSGAFLFRADLNNTDLRGANLSGADLPHANLSRANLIGANLSGTDLIGANLSGAGLGGADLFEANLRGTDLSEADLSVSLESKLRVIGKLSDLSETNLVGANLTDADLTNANLSGVNLAGALVTTEQLTSTRSLQGATMPDGSDHP